jgi:hypothetical protein
MHFEYKVEFLKVWGTLRVKKGPLANWDRVNQITIKTKELVDYELRTVNLHSSFSYELLRKGCLDRYIFDFHESSLP